MSIANDLALIQCIYGKNQLQIRAAKTALCEMLRVQPRPQDWIFVEAQKPGESYEFDYLEQYGIKHIKKVIQPQNEYIFHKEQMWNIGVHNTNCNYLCFVDADVCFREFDVFARSKSYLEKYELIQLCSEIIREGETGGYLPTTALCIQNGLVKNGNFGKPGFNFGMTREFYNKFGGFESMATSSGDIWFWHTVLGEKKYPYANWYMPYNETKIMCHGLLPNTKVGCVMGRGTHIFHGEAKYRLYKGQNIISRLCTSYPFEDVQFDPNSDELASWKDTTAAKIHKECRKILEEKKSNKEIDDVNAVEVCTKIYEDVSEKYYGKIDAEHPLVILTCFEKGPNYDTWIVESVKELWDRFCLTPHRFICLTNEKIDGVETIPFELNWKQRKMFFNQQEMFRKLFDENTSVLAVDLDVVPIREFKMHRCPENYISMTMEFNNWYKGRVLWNAGIMYFRGDFSFVYDEYKKHAGLEKTLRDPSFCFISSQEFISGALFKHDIPIHDVLNHITLELFKTKTNINSYPRQNSKVVHFLAEPKPWNANVPWLVIHKPS